jgi:acetyl-CoA acetyltransferase
MLGFQLLIPCLEQMKVVNPGSFMYSIQNNDSTMKEFYVFPGFVNDILQFVRPVISLDAAHLKSKHKGTLFVATALSGADPTIMLTGPMPAARKVLAKAGLTVDDIDLFEVNEAFAAVPMRFMQEMHVPHEKVNVNGGSIALGHPLGATGAMLVGTLLDELERRKLKRGLITLCVGGGMGIATIIERV